MRYKVDAVIETSYTEIQYENFSDTEGKVIKITKTYNIDLFETDELRETADKYRITSLIRKEEVKIFQDLGLKEKQKVTTDNILIFIRDTKTNIYKQIDLTPSRYVDIDVDYLKFLVDGE